MRKKKTTTANAIRQAELILKLYELRRETVMREARSYVGGEFLPASATEFIQIVSAGNKQSSFVLQVYGYWQMVAAFVKSGALDAELLYDTCPEMYFQYAKIQPYLAQFREEMDLPEFFALSSRAKGWRTVLLKILYRYWTDRSIRCTTRRDRRFTNGASLMGPFYKRIFERGIDVRLETKLERETL